MLIPRIIPLLLLKGKGLVKTVKFGESKYLGDPRNIMRIFNEKEVDEIIILDIMATPEKRGPQFDLIREIVSEAFMPVAYGGGIRNIEDIKQLINSGVEKVAINSYAIENPGFVREAVSMFGSQSIIISMDIKRNLLGRHEVFTCGGRKNIKIHPVDWAKQIEQLGAGEILVNSIDRDGTMLGYDLELIKSVSSVVGIPVIACGGAGKISDFSTAIKEGRASAVAAGSIFVFQGKHRAVLISYPGTAQIHELFARN